MPWPDVWTYGNWAFQAAIVVAAVVVSRWRRRRITEEVALLPEDMRRLVGPAPYHMPPPAERRPEGLRRYAAQYDRFRRPGRLLWGVFALWVAVVVCVAVIQEIG
ncbi:hypothetical protein [Salipiger mucosus]|uniref:Uncharacterized protein n=1 Tax=Salipiger mucosus DSM 16094 TaxID=1123237 RepID=S9R4U4_9RHOB|nr:hypothetical protein [Salipiger mucosus]EPX86947.1 hypothetical protein Salmuc_02922 [Salipiger mucosus DSM 16094]